MQFSGAWSRERHVKERRLEQGIQSVGSIRGNSSHEHNPFIVLRRPSATENAGEVMGFSLIYSGNHRMQAEVDTHDTTRITAGINPQNFDWKLDCGESFQTPEAVVVFSDKGLNGMSQTFHKLYQKRLARGYWRVLTPWFSDVSGVSFSGAFLFVRSRIYSITGVRSLTYSN